MQSGPLRVVLMIGLLCCELQRQSSEIQAANDVSSVDKVFATVAVTSAVASAVGLYALTQNPTVAACGGLTAASVVKGIYNVRYYNQILSQCELDYEIKPYVHWLQYPSQFVQNMICMDSGLLDMIDKADHGTCLSEIQKKIIVFDTVDLHVIWNFEKFKDTLPHTNFQSAYCISKAYMGAFGYRTLGALKSAIAYQLFKVEHDFNLLISLTDLSWSHIKMPKTLDECNELKFKLSSCSHYYGAYSFFGACGYSPVHNGQRAKDCLVDLAKIHAFLINFQELMKACVDDDATELINVSGMLNFSLQHIHYIQKKV